MNISAEQHVHVLAAAQRNVDNSVSKTCNGAVNDTVESVDSLYRLGRQLGCKAVSYYRDGSRDNQVLTSMKAEDKGELACNPEAQIEVCDEPPASHADAAIIAPITTDAAHVAPVSTDSEVLARQQIQADTAAAAIPEGSDAGVHLGAQAAVARQSGRAQTQAQSKQYASSARASCAARPGRFRFDGQNLYVTVNHDGQMIQEVFATGPISGGVGLLASKMLRGGFDAAEVAYSLNKVTARMPFGSTSVCLLHPNRQLPSAS